MKRSFLFFLLLFFSVIGFGQNESGVFSIPYHISAEDYIPNTLIVKFRQPQLRSGIYTSNAISACNLKLKSAAVTEVKKVFPGRVNVASEKREGNMLSSMDDEFGLDRFQYIKFEPKLGVSIQDVAKEIAQNADVESVDMSYVYRTAAIPNDPKYTGNGQSYLTQINAPYAWAISIDPNVEPIVIAIVDSGSQLDHEDLADNIAPGGYDLVGAFRARPQPDNDPNVVSLSGSHGVHVSGIASAVTNNGKGVASIAYNHAKLLIVKVCGDDYPTYVVKGYEGIVYAVDHGAKIINCSWGGAYSGFFGQSVINYALSKGCLVVAAAGNNGTNIVDFPAAYAGVFAVTSVSSYDIKSNYAQYGKEVDISAPGGEDGSKILSTVFGGGYAGDYGTSMAAPVVSSAAALVKAAYPELTMQQVGERLKATAENIDYLNPNYVGKIGAGRLDVNNAITSNDPFPSQSNLKFVLQQNYPNPAKGSTFIKFTLPNDGDASLSLISMEGKLVRSFFDGYQYKGDYASSFSLDYLPPGVYIYRLVQGDKSSSRKLVVE